MKLMQLLLCFLFVIHLVATFDCINYAFYPIDDSYYERRIHCPTNNCVKYVVTAWRGSKRMTFFLGNCDELRLCRPNRTKFSTTLTPHDFALIFGEKPPSGMTNIELAGKCCDHQSCNVL